MKQIAALCTVLFALWISTFVDAGFLHGNPHHASAVATSSVYAARTVQTGTLPVAHGAGVYAVNSYQSQGVSSNGGSSGNRGVGRGGHGGSYDNNYGNSGSYGGFYPPGNANSNGNYGGYGHGLQN